MVHRIAAINVLVNDEYEDAFYWSGASNGEFSMKSAYDAISKLEGGSAGTVWKAIWREKIPQRVRCFMWLGTKERLRGITLVPFSRATSFLVGPFVPGNFLLEITGHYFPKE